MAAVVVAALVATLVVASPAGAASKTLSFGDAPAGWSVTSGEADANLGKVAASGVKKNRIRYSLQGPSGFSVKARSGVVSYDGTEYPAGEALVTVTARDRKGKRSEATVTITVAVTAAQPQLQVQQPQQQNMEPRSDPTLEMYQADWVRTYRDDGYRTVMKAAPSLYPMIGEGRSEEAFIYVDTYDAMKKDGTSLTWELDQESKDLGFFLEQMQITGASQGTPQTRHVPYAKSSEQTIALSYNGKSWGEKDLSNFKIKITGTTDEPEPRKNTVEIEVCFLRSQ